MRKIDEEIRVAFGDSDIILVEDIVIWNEIREYIDRRFEWLASEPQRPSFNKKIVISNSLPPDAIDVQSPTLAPGLLSIFEERKINYTLWVLGIHGGRLHNRKAYEAMVKIGYTDNSATPPLNVVSKVRKYPTLITLDKGYFQLTQEGLAAYEKLKQIAYPSESSVERVSEPVVAIPDYKDDDIRLADDADKPENLNYLLHALYKLGGSATFADLIEPMIADGWVTRSDTHDKQKRNLSAIVSSRGREYVDSDRGRVTINAKGYERLRAMEIATKSEAHEYNNDSPNLSFDELKPELSLKT